MMEIDPVQRHLFLEGIYLRYGYDFRGYSTASLDRRLASLMTKEETPNLLTILQNILASPDYFRRVVAHLTINTTEFFRDPLFFKSLRETVFPFLSTYPSLRIWTAGCSTGQETISLAILLDDAGLLERSTIYATDIDTTALKQAREGIYEISALQDFAKSYTVASGVNSPSDYYVSEYNLIRFERRLLENIVFSEHNLATDAAFTEAHLILCRNVLIYFSRELQSRAVELFMNSLTPRGFLGLGSKETLRFTDSRTCYESVDAKQNLFRLKGAGLISGGVA